MTIDTRLFVLQPTSFCNLNCSYCYVPDRQNTSHMSSHVLEKSIQCLFKDKIKGDIKFLYHAGKPLTVGKAFYQQAMNLINKYKLVNVSVTNSIQTNGTLINEDWIEFFIKYNFKVGISIDGPEFLHDLNRKNWIGLGSFQKALRGFKLLRKHNVSTGILSVITSEHLKHPEELIQFYLQNEMTDVGFNIEEIENFNKESSLGTIKNIKSKEYYEFMNKLFDLNLMYGDSIKIREISDIIHMIYHKNLNPKYKSEPLETINLGIVTVQRNGDISTYCPEFAGMESEEYNNFVIGNVTEIERLSDVINNKFYKKIKNNYDQRKTLCKNTCNYFSFCGSSFLSNAFSESKSLLTTENIGCILHMKYLTDVVVEKMKSLSS